MVRVTFARMDENYDDLHYLCERYYGLIWKHYMFQVSCITREDYERMQQAIVGYTQETYEQHMTRLTQGIPHDVNVMLRHMRSFLQKYVAFQEPRYADMIEKMGEKMRSDRNAFKMQALEILKEGAQANEANEGQVQAEELSQHPPLFETYVGPSHFVLPTYCNPLMTCFYSLLFVCFAGFQAQDIDQSVSSGQ